MGPLRYSAGSTWNPRVCEVGFVHLDFNKWMIGSNPGLFFFKYHHPNILYRGYDVLYRFSMYFRTSPFSLLSDLLSVSCFLLS